MSRPAAVLALLAACFLPLTAVRGQDNAAAGSDGDPRFSFTGYFGRQARNKSSSLFLAPTNPNWVDAYVAAGALEYEAVQHSRGWYALGVGGYLGIKFGDETFGEFGAFGFGRWKAFPWDRWVNTSLTAGLGLSVATAVAELENDRGLESANLLPHLVLEWEFQLPDNDQWGVVYRIHHRSGAYGIFADDGSSSDFLTLGVKYHW